MELFNDPCKLDHKKSKKNKRKRKREWELRHLLERAPKFLCAALNITNNCYLIIEVIQLCLTRKFYKSASFFHAHQLFDFPISNTVSIITPTIFLKHFLLQFYCDQIKDKIVDKVTCFLIFIYIYHCGTLWWKKHAF